MELLSNENKQKSNYLELLHFFSEGSDDCFYILELKENKIYFSKDLNKKYEFLHIENNSCDVSEIVERVYSRDINIFNDEMKKIKRKEKDIYDLTYRILDDKDRIIWIHSRGKVQYDENGEPCTIIGQVSEKLTKYKVDVLTGAFNVSQLIDDISEICKTGRINYLLAIGIDDMKHINLKNGREYGNNLLRKMVKEFEQVIKEYDNRIYRINGDCFAVMLNNAGKQNVKNIYHDMCDKFKGICSLSGGAVEYDKNTIIDGNTMYQCVEIALDEAKKQGKSNLRFFKEKDYQNKISIVRLQDSLKNSILNDFQNFSLNYQPQIDLKNHKLYGAEALLRYIDPERGNIPPTEFVPILEETDMICDVGIWVLKTAIKQCKIWRKKVHDFHISVNLSYSQLKQPNIAQLVLDILEENELSGKALTLEVTESMQLHDYHRLNNIFSCWKAAGIEISVDDFGTGYSSLNRLQKLDIDEIKIDRCFITEIQNSLYNYQLVNNVIKLADNGNMRVCCEGVETEDELAVLQKLGPKLLQGYLFGKPYSTEEFEKRYINSNDLPELICKNIDAKLDNIVQNTHNTREQQLEKILDSLEDCVYVSDMKTYDVYYMNKAHMKMLGIDRYEGKKCYQLMQGKIAPCEMCKKWDLKEKDPNNWNIYNMNLNKNLLIKDRIIDWNGKTARLQVIKAIDINEIKKKEIEQSNNSINDVDIIGSIDLGFWIMDISDDKKSLIVSNIMRKSLSIPDELDKYQTYDFWYSHIDKSYRTYVDISIDRMFKSNRITQIEYIWNHPENDQMISRIVGAINQNGTTYVNGYHRIISNMQALKNLSGKSIREQFEYNCSNKSVLFHTGRDIIFGDDIYEENFPECWIQKEMIHPHFINEFKNIFSNINKKSEIINGKEFLIKSNDGAYNWYNLKTRYISDDLTDLNTMVVILETINRDRAIELEYARVKDFYHVLLGEAVAYAEVDMESREIKSIGGLWKDYPRICKDENISFIDLLLKILKPRVSENDFENFKKYCDTSKFETILQKDKSELRFSYQCEINGNSNWVELIIHLFRERTTKNIYALIYLKDIDRIKTRELEQDKMANLDPLTNIFNRRAFEREVIKYMTDPNQKNKGALIIMDIDNFKNINDEYGHAAGDQALKNLANILVNTFRTYDIVARMGGDEFQVFLKNIYDCQIIDKRMQGFLNAVNSQQSLPFTCSIGICMVDSDDFSYQDALEKADKALYKSKRNGKNQYSYSDD